MCCYCMFQGNATLHLYPHFKPLSEYPGKQSLSFYTYLLPIFVFEFMLNQTWKIYQSLFIRSLSLYSFYFCSITYNNLYSTVSNTCYLLVFIVTSRRKRGYKLFYEIEILNHSNHTFIFPIFHFNLTFFPLVDAFQVLLPPRRMYSYLISFCCCCCCCYFTYPLACLCLLLSFLYYVPQHAAAIIFPGTDGHSRLNREIQLQQHAFSLAFTVK